MRVLSVIGFKMSSGGRATIVESHGMTMQRRNNRSLLKVSKSLCVLVLTAAFVFLQAYEYPLAKRIQSKAIALAEPVSRLISKPFLWIENVNSYFSRQQSLLEQHEQLKLQNDYLVRLHHSTQQHIDENQKLREALNVKNVIIDDIITARVTHHTFDGFSSQYYLSVTAKDGVEKNDSILTTSGNLLGRVIEAEDGHVRLMTVNDANSSVPVQFESTREQAMITGNNGKLLNITRVENPSAVRPGDRLITSGVGGIYPAGIPVAVIVSVDNNKIKAAPHATVKDLDFVLIVSHHLHS